jgi:hypothetical protein
MVCDSDVMRVVPCGALLSIGNDCARCSLSTSLHTIDTAHLHAATGRVLADQQEAVWAVERAVLDGRGR